MAVANVKVILNEDIKSVWEMVTSLNNCAWRSDLSLILHNSKKGCRYK